MTEQLTDRERQVLLMVAEGQGIRQIAHLLGITEHTARKHRDNAVQAVGQGSQTAAVVVVLGLRDTATA